jgi:hypothetical protein
MNLRIGRSEFPASYFVRLWIAAGLSTAVAWGIKLAARPHDPKVAAVVILIPYGLDYLGLTAAMGIDQAATMTKRLMRAVGTSRGK